MQLAQKSLCLIFHLLGDLASSPCQDSPSPSAPGRCKRACLSKTGHLLMGLVKGMLGLYQDERNSTFWGCLGFLIMLVWELCDGIPGPKSVRFYAYFGILRHLSLRRSGRKNWANNLCFANSGPKRTVFPVMQSVCIRKPCKDQGSYLWNRQKNALKCMQLKTMERLLPTYCTQSNALKRALKTTLLDRQKNTQKNWT